MPDPLHCRSDTDLGLCRLGRLPSFRSKTTIGRRQELICRDMPALEDLTVTGPLAAPACGEFHLDASPWQPTSDIILRRYGPYTSDLMDAD
jgi:hypothetical protein